MEDVLVSVWCVTYNHEAYIRDAIEGFLAQKTNFRYEIIIHDDASTDKTAEIVKEYEKKYPNLVRGIYQETNQFKKNQPNIKWIQDIAIQNCRGKYIAACEGDDYWIDIQKLQLQFDYLELHPECVMAVHDAVNVDCRNYEIKSGSIYERDCIVPAADIIVQKKYMFSASMMYRKEVLYMDKFFCESGIGDYSSLLYSLTKGNIYYFTRIMSVYRQHHIGSWSFSFLTKESSRWEHSILMLDFLEKYNKYTAEKFSLYVSIRLQKSAMNILGLCSNMSSAEFEKTCAEYEEQLGEKYELIFRKIKRLWRQLFDENYVDTKLRRFISGCQRIVIMGAGMYAGILAKQFSSQGIPFEGFVVSDNQWEKSSFCKKPVWKLSSLPFDLKASGIIIGINPVIWEEILCSLHKAGAGAYICPFLFEFKGDNDDV